MALCNLCWGPNCAKSANPANDCNCPDFIAVINTARQANGVYNNTFRSLLPIGVRDLSDNVIDAARGVATTGLVIVEMGPTAQKKNFRNRRKSKKWCGAPTRRSAKPRSRSPHLRAPKPGTRTALATRYATIPICPARASLQHSCTSLSAHFCTPTTWHCQRDLALSRGCQAACLAAHSHHTHETTRARARLTQQLHLQNKCCYRSNKFTFWQFADAHKTHAAAPRYTPRTSPLIQRLQLLRDHDQKLPRTQPTPHHPLATFPNTP